MTQVAEVYRILNTTEEPAARIQEKDQWRLLSSEKEFWAPVDLFIGHPLKDFDRMGVAFRRLTYVEVVP